MTFNYLGLFNTNSLCNKNSFRLHLNIDIETSQLILLLRTFQIRAFMLLKDFAPGSTQVHDNLEYCAHGYYHCVNISTLYILAEG